jgi:hypothetical protein
MKGIIALAMLAGLLAAAAVSVAVEPVVASNPVRVP